MNSGKKNSMLMLMGIVMLAALTMMAGCKGSDGSNGTGGANGTNGITSATNEACMVCHTTGETADISSIKSASTNSNLVVTVTSVASNASGSIVVNFHIDQISSTGTTTFFTYSASKSAASIKIASLIPARTGSNTWSTDYWEMWTAETPGQAAHPMCLAGWSLDWSTTKGGTNTCYQNFTTVSSAGTNTTPATAALVNNGAGNYTYTMATPWGGAWPGYNNADYALGTSLRVAIELSTVPSGWNKAKPGILDITGDPGAGNTATSISSVRQFVTIEACRKCHGPLMDNAAHANNRNDMRECVFCHSPLYGSTPSHAAGFMADDNADLPVFIHGIHGSTWTDTDDFAGGGVNGVGPSVAFPVTYPQPLNKCDVCHSNPGGAPGDLTALDNWKSHPTGRVCHSCHTSNIITAGTTTILPTFTHDATLTIKGTQPLPTGSRDDTQCTSCHDDAGTPGDYTDIVTAHSTSATGNDVPEYDVLISMSTPSNTTTEAANGVTYNSGTAFPGYYVSGETVTVDVTLASHATGSPVAASLYTTAQDSAYHAGGGLHVANLYVYGPRSDAKPLIGTTQAISLFGKGDATGFHYSFVVPANATAGVYMVRARIGDYSYDRNNPTGGGTHAYQVESYALSNFFIGANVAATTGISAVPAHASAAKTKISGDACVDCHGVTVMHANDHAAPFDTDHCLSCHDQSGGFAAYIGNRVHAIHDANPTGDMVDNRDWSAVQWTLPMSGVTMTTPITFPQTIAANTCTICHTSGDTTYKSNIYESVCLGCHGDSSDALAHMLQNGGKFQKTTAK